MKPIDIPSAPDKKYSGKGWKSWGDWLGTGKRPNSLVRYRTFEQAKTHVHSLKLKSYSEWMKYCHSGMKPDDIPYTPHVVYRQKGWSGLGDWLGTGTIATFQRKYRTYKQARKFVHSLKLSSAKDWEIYCRSGDKPSDIPACPHRIYRSKGWTGSADWLGKVK